MPKLLETKRIPQISQECQLVSGMKETYRVSWEQELSNLRNGKGIETEMLISASVTVPIGPVQLASKMRQLEPPTFYRGPVQLLTGAPKSSKGCSWQTFTSAYSMYERGEVHSKEFLKSIRPSNHIPNYFIECDKIKRQGEETDEWCKTLPQRTVRIQMGFFFFQFF